MDFDAVLKQLKDGLLSGNDLKNMVERNEITKSDRRKLTKRVQKIAKKGYYLRIYLAL